MRNVILLIRRYSNFLTFLLMQVLSIAMLVKYNTSHQAAYMQLSYELTGRINTRFNAITTYFTLGETNRQLAAENERLRNLLGQNYTTIDTSGRLRLDTVWLDSSRLTRKFFWRSARVINNSVASQNNYITLERGRNQGILPDMAVMGPAGIVGVVTDVSNNMSIVMSLLHRKSATSVMLKKDGTTGILEWNGLSPRYLQMKGVPKSTEVKIGDTVLTSNISLNYPSGLMVGTVARIDKETGDNNYRLQVRTASNFYSLDHVDVIENVFLKEQMEIEQRAKRQ